MKEISAAFLDLLVCHCNDKQEPNCKILHRKQTASVTDDATSTVFIFRNLPWTSPTHCYIPIHGIVDRIFTLAGDTDWAGAIMTGHPVAHCLRSVRYQFQSVAEGRLFGQHPVTTNVNNDEIANNIFQFSLACESSLSQG